ncbi:glycosyltransferase family A protein [Roseateles sp.]|uniref:glycosyltransferase family 2 protein n=1 Tax=Roseateles sp. TaxID=1971397 RepID=UPI002F400470
MNAVTPDPAFAGDERAAPTAAATVAAAAARVPAVSVVIPLFNKERDIGRAIDSVLAQAWSDFELVVVDDGSSDGCAAVVAAYDDPRLRMERQANAGVSAARNRGVALSRAPWVAFLDADDAWTPSFLGDVLALAARHPEAAGVALNYEIVSPGGARALGVDPADAPAQLLDPLAYFRIGRHAPPLSSSSVVVRREALLAAGGFPVGVRLGEDIDTWLRLLFRGGVYFDPRPGAQYFADASNRALNTHAPPARYAFFDTIEGWLAAHPERVEERREAEEFMNFFRLLHARHQIRWGDAQAGRRLLSEIRTTVHRGEKRRLQVLSRLPRPCYDGLARLKRKLLSLG